MRRIICFVLSLTMVIGLLGGLDFSVFATDESAATKAELIDVDIYLAQCLAGIAQDVSTGAVEDCNEIYNYYINEGIFSPTKSFLDSAYADKDLMSAFDDWTMYTLGQDSSSIVNHPIQKKDYYEALILAIIAQEFGEDSQKSQDVLVTAAGYSATIVDSLCAITDSADRFELMANFDIDAPGAGGKFKQIVDTDPKLGGFDAVEIILSGAETLEEAIDKMAGYYAMRSLDEDIKQWLESMYNACDKDTDLMLKDALFNLKNSSTDFAGAFLISVKDTRFRLGSWGISTTINAGMSTLAAMHPLTAALMAGIKLGKSICDICFSTTDICEQFFLLECMYDIQGLARTVAEEARVNFINSQTNENARSFTYATHFYFESIINTDINSLISFLDLVYNGGILKGAIKWVYGASDDYQEVVDSLESLRETRQNNYTLMLRLHQAALAINHKDTYDYYYTVDPTVPITGISFWETWLLPMEVGDFSNLYVQYEPSNTTQRAYTVTSDNPEVVEVHDNIVTAVAEGTANVTIRSVENPEVSYTAKITVAAKTEDTGTEDPKPEGAIKFTYTVADGKATITGLVDGYAPSNLSIPSRVAGYPVVSIGYEAFKHCTSLKRVAIPNSVTRIGDEAFHYCSSLTSVTIPDSVTSIGWFAFEGCSSLTDIFITDLAAWVSISHHGWKSLPTSANSLEKRLYLNGELLTDAVIPEGVTSIGEYAFEGCSSLTGITIPDSVTSIGDRAFRDCSGLTSVTISDGVTTIGSYVFSGCSSLTGISIPGSVTSIGEGAFYECSSLTSITISEGVTSIGNYAFEGCSSLTSITLPDSVTSIESGTFYDCSGLTSITIPESVTSIGDYAFRDCSGLTSITIPESVTSIGYRAFWGCSGLTSITIPESVTSIGSYAFEGCSSLTSITLPDSVTSIKSGTFYDCSGLTSITIPESVTSIGDYAFRDCSGLTSITIPESVTSIGDYAFRDCSSLTSVTIPESVTSIGSYAFRDCSGLTSITIPESVTSIGSYAFDGCSSLTGIWVDQNNECYSSDDRGVLFNKDKTELIRAPGAISGAYIIPESVTSIGNWAFSGCYNLESITIPEGVTSIGSSAFSGCSSLTSITIPGSVTSIGSYAFSGCSSLTEITFAGDASSFGTDVFNNVIATAYYPANNATWTASKKQNYGGRITWIALGNLTGLELSNTFYAVGDDAVDVLAIYDNGVGRPLNPGTYTVSGLDFSTIGKKTVAVSYQGLTVEFDVYVHSGRGTVTVDSSLYPESAHNYGNYLDDVQIFRIPGASSITLTFSAATWFENNCDKLYLLDKNDNEISRYTGSQAAGITVTVPGDTVKLRLVTDGSTTYYGYSFSEIKAEQVFHVEETIMGMAPTCTESGISEGRYCSICNEVLVAQEEIPATGHTEVIDAAVDATCTTTGLTEGKHCSVCNEVLIAQKEVAATGHTFDDDKDETCNSCGYVREVNNLPVPAKPYKITNVVSGVHVYWKATEGAVKYGLWRSETGINGTYKWIANPTVPHFTDTKVESGKTYYYKVTSMDASGKHTDKSAAIGLTYVSTPDISARYNKAAGVKLDWKKVTGATGYAIYRKSYSGNDAWVRVGTISGNETFTWTDTSVKNNNGTAYKYTIRALAGSNMKTLSGCRNAGRSMVRLTSRTLSSATKASATSIKCSWNTSAAVTGYEVRFIVDGVVYKTFTVGDYKIGVKTFTGLKAGQTYKIQVRSYKKIDGMCFYSAWSTAKEVKL